MSNLIPLSRGILSLNDIRAIWSRDPQPSNTSYLDRRYTINIRYVNVTHHFVYDYTTEAERNKDLGEIWDCLNDTDRAHIYKPVMTEEEEEEDFVNVVIIIKEGGCCFLLFVVIKSTIGCN